MSLLRARCGSAVNSLFFPNNSLFYFWEHHFCCQRIKTDAERGCSIIINAGVINKLFVFIKKNVYFYILNYYILIFLDYFNMLILKLIFKKILFCQYKQNTSYVSRSESEFFCFLLLTKFSITKYRVSSWKWDGTAFWFPNQIEVLD
jgi:hypothetical protein